MAHFCKLGKGNKVITIEVVNNDSAPNEQAGIYKIYIKIEQFGNKHLLMEVKEKIMLESVLHMIKQEMLLYHLIFLIAGH